MKIAILTSGIMPVPAVKGGAVENLTDFYLAYNDQNRLHDITVYSIADPAAKGHAALLSPVNHYRFIDVSSLRAKCCKHLFRLCHSKDCYYHYTIEFFLHQAMKDISRRHYDVIILENRPAYALKLKAVTDAKLVYHLHNGNLNPQTARCEEIYNAADLILTVSDYIKSQVTAVCPTDSKTITVHNGIDLSAFSPGVKPVERAALGLSANDFVILFSGRVTKEKGIMQLLDAMLLIDKPNIRLLVLGSSFYGNADNNTSYAQALMRKAEPLKDRIISTGFIPYGQMPRYLKTADIAVMPSVWDEPFGLTVAEAQAMGLPIITTRRGGIPEVVTEDNALLLDTGEHFTEHLAEAILHLCQHPEKRKAMGEAASKRATLFSKERYVRDFFDAIEKLTSSYT